MFHRGDRRDRRLLLGGGASDRLAPYGRSKVPAADGPYSHRPGRGPRSGWCRPDEHQARGEAQGLVGTSSASSRGARGLRSRWGSGARCAFLGIWLTCAGALGPFWPVSVRDSLGALCLPHPGGGGRAGSGPTGGRSLGGAAYSSRAGEHAAPSGWSSRHRAPCPVWFWSRRHRGEAGYIREAPTGWARPVHRRGSQVSWHTRGPADPHVAARYQRCESSGRKSQDKEQAAPSPRGPSRRVRGRRGGGRGWRRFGRGQRRGDGGGADRPSSESAQQGAGAEERLGRAPRPGRHRRGRGLGERVFRGAGRSLPPTSKCVEPFAPPPSSSQGRSSP